MQQGITIVCITHLSDRLPFGDPVTFLYQDLSIVPVSTQIFIVVFDDDKPAIANQSTPAVHDSACFGSTDLTAAAPTDLDAVAQGIGCLES